MIGIFSETTAVSIFKNTEYYIFKNNTVL